MIVVQDSYLPERVFKGLQEEVNDTHFEIVKAGEKEFLCMETPRWLYEYLKVEGHRIIFTFIRKAHRDFDTEFNAHCDSIINGSRPALASVLYINDDEGVTPNGTAFWKHHKYGFKAPENVQNEEFDRLLTQDSNDISKWRKSSYIEAIPNRLLLYSADYFHSKWPQVIEQGERIVCATFYEKI